MGHKNIDEKRAYHKNYYASHRAQFLQKSKEQRINNPEAQAKSKREYHIRNRDKLLAKGAIYRKLNREKIILQRRLLRQKKLDKLGFSGIENCQICGRHKSEFNKGLAIDHCHKTGTIRGLLCYICNTSLGRFNDNIKSLENAILYLKKYNTPQETNQVEYHI